jgi:hypothetical protein
VKSPKKPINPQAQVEKFRDLARELECDDDEGRFDERLRKIAKTSRGAPGDKGGRPPK